MGIAIIIESGDKNAAKPNPPKTTIRYNNFFSLDKISSIISKGFVKILKIISEILPPNQETDFDITIAFSFDDENSGIIMFVAI